MATPISIPSDYFSVRYRFNHSKIPDDFTFYSSNTDEIRSLTGEDDLDLGTRKKNSWAGEVRLIFSGTEIPCRALVCSSYGGRLWSITVRLGKGNREFGTPPPTLRRADLPRSNFSPRTERGDKHLNSFSEITECLFEAIFDAIAHPTGLIVISGSTGSGKSQIVRGLLDGLLRRFQADVGRSPHLVTYEDPIEEYFFDLPDPVVGIPGQPMKLQSQPFDIDYSPREGGKDSDSLTESLRDALRQTPKIFYVGETRAVADWRELFHFAGTGHLVITTAHAGSLLESMQLLLKATETKTPTERNHLASRLLAAVHLKKIKAEQREILLPSIWTQRTRTINDFTANGLGSIVPGKGNLDHNFGRSYFAEQLLKKAEDSGEIRALEFEKIKTAVRLSSIAFDLAGE